MEGIHRFFSSSFFLFYVDFLVRCRRAPTTRGTTTRPALYHGAGKPRIHPRYMRGVGVDRARIFRWVGDDTLRPEWYMSFRFDSGLFSFKELLHCH